MWSESIAVGSERFIEATRKKLGYPARGRKIVEKDDMFSLREPHVSYNTDFDLQNRLLSVENAYCWNILTNKQRIAWSDPDCATAISLTCRTRDPVRYNLPSRRSRSLTRFAIRWKIRRRRNKKMSRAPEHRGIIYSTLILRSVTTCAKHGLSGLPC